MAENKADILKLILSMGADPALQPKKRRQAPIPGEKELDILCDLLAQEPEEELLQKYFEENPGYLTGMFGTNDNSDLAILFKPPVGNQCKADFAVLQCFQGGAVVHLIEIETCHEKVFTQKLTPAKRYQGAIGQVKDWRDILNKDGNYHVREFIRMAREVPMFSEHGNNARGIRFYEPDELERKWEAFGGYTQPCFSFGIIIGRWSKLSKEEKERLVSENRNRPENLVTYTYEQLARQANYRSSNDEF